MSPNQPTSFRYPFDHVIDNADGTHQAVKDAIRYAFTGLKDLNDAVKQLNGKVNTNKNAITTVTTTVTQSGGVAPPPPPPPAFGNVNLQPNLTPGAYNLAQSDSGGLIMVQSGIPFALTLNSALVTPFFTTVYNLGAGTITATPSLGNVNNVVSVPLATNAFGIFYFDGTNWWDVFAASGSTINFADGETAAGSGTAFTLAHSPSPALSLILVQYVVGFGGITLIAGTDYTLLGAAITTVNTLSAGALTAWYRY